MSELLTLLLNLVLALALGQILAWHYVRFAKVLGNRARFARIFPFIAGTTLLIIAVVKTSLALSVGLIGALSIIRFRTPVKEPEELAHLFLAIAVGIGFGAERSYTTVAVFAVLLVFLTIRGMNEGKQSGLHTILQVTWPKGAGTLQDLLTPVEAQCRRVDLRRADSTKETTHASLLVELDGPARVQALLTAIETALPGAETCIVERDGLEA